MKESGFLSFSKGREGDNIGFVFHSPWSPNEKECLQRFTLKSFVYDQASLQYVW